MAGRRPAIGPRQREMLSWAAGLGAVSAEALAAREGRSMASARARLAAADRAGHVRAWRLLDGEPALYTVTRDGLRAAGRAELTGCSLSPGSATHAAACCSAAVQLEASYPGQRIVGEPEIRSSFGALCPRIAGRGGPRTHRPDLLVLPPSESERPVAVEVELTVKGPERLLRIARAWSRQGAVVGVVYFAAGPVLAPLERAIDRAHARGQIVVLPL